MVPGMAWPWVWPVRLLGRYWTHSLVWPSGSTVRKLRLPRKLVVTLEETATPLLGKKLAVGFGIGDLVAVTDQLILGGVERALEEFDVLLVVDFDDGDGIGIGQEKGFSVAEVVFVEGAHGGKVGDVVGDIGEVRRGGEEVWGARGR